MGVDLSGADVGVAEHGLDGADVGAVHEEIGGKTVAEGVGGDMLGDAGCTSVFFDDAFDGAGGETAEITRSVNFALTATIVEEEWSESILAFVEIGGNPVGGGGRNENGAIFAAFAANDEFATVEIDGVAVEFDEFGDAETAGE